LTRRFVPAPDRVRDEKDYPHDGIVIADGLR